MSFPILVSVLASICPEWITNSALRRGPFSPGGNGLISMPGDANAVDSDALTFAHGGAALRVTEGRAPVGYDPVFWYVPENTIPDSRAIEFRIQRRQPRAFTGSVRMLCAIRKTLHLYATRYMVYAYTLYSARCTLYAICHTLYAVHHTRYTIATHTIAVHYSYCDTLCVMCYTCHTQWVIHYTWHATHTYTLYMAYHNGLRRGPAGGVLLVRTLFFGTYQKTGSFYL